MMFRALLSYVKRRFNRILFPAFILLCVFYLGYHAFAGDHSILSYFKIKKDISNLQTELTQIKTDNADLLQKIVFLRGKTLNLDFVDVLLHEQLGLVPKKDTLVVVSPSQYSCCALRNSSCCALRNSSCCVRDAK